MKISVVILAAGNSKRFGSDKLKHKINGISVLEKTIKIFIKNKNVNEIVVVAHPDKQNILKNKYSECKLIFVETNYRSESTLEGLKFVTNTKVLIHDAARCFIKQETINSVIKKLKNKNAIIPVKLATSTYHIVKDGAIKQIINRKKLYEAQTPQGFNTQELLEILRKSDLTMTDEASIYFKNGIKVYVLEVEDSNIKITNIEDTK